MFPYRLQPQLEYAVFRRADGLEDEEIAIGPEHTEARWLALEDARATLRWESNRPALRELNDRLTR